MDMQKWLDKAIELGSEYGIKVLGTIVIWIVGNWIIKKMLKVLTKGMARSDYDTGLQKFLRNLVGWTLKVLLIIAILGNLGIETTSFAAILAAAGLAVGLALQGSLSNFAGGVLLMIFKPFKLGDVIEAQGEIGVVKEIEIFTTKLNTPDNKEVIIPNGVLSNGNITNYSSEKYRRVDIIMGVSYNADIKHTKDVLLKVITDNNKVLKDPEPVVQVRELADSSVNFNVRPWVLNEDYWTVYAETIEGCKLALDAAGIEIPYPHIVEIRKKE
jgi:small conductance mechanosensitive channel